MNPEPMTAAPARRVDVMTRTALLGTDITFGHRKAKVPRSAARSQGPVDATLSRGWTSGGNRTFTEALPGGHGSGIMSGT